MGKKKEVDEFAAERITEDVIGTVQASSIPKDEPAPTWGLKRFRCTRCDNGYHNTPKDDTVCRGGPCKCPCRTHYIGRDGRLRPYGTPDDSIERAKAQEWTPTKENEDAFQRIMSQIRKPKEEPTTEA